MKSFTALLVFAAFVGLSTCMSVVENQDDDDVSNNGLGWWYHYHYHYRYHFFHYHDLAEEQPEVTKCSTNPCYLCKRSSVDVSLHKNLATANYEYNGCLVISRTPDNKYNVGVTIDDELQYETAFTTNEFINLPCIYPSENKSEGRICPHMYNVDLENGIMCASLDEYLKVMDTKMLHKNKLGCVQMY